jgi:hypothetical protein
VTRLNQGDKQFEGVLSLYLQQRQLSKGASNNQSHLDEDYLSAFVEGALTQSQAAPILKHLVDCVLCRRVTAQLAQLSIAFDDAQFNSDNAETNKSNWRELWNTLTESVFRPHDNAVIAHEEERDLNEKKDPESSKK